MKNITKNLRNLFLVGVFVFSFNNHAFAQFDTWIDQTPTDYFNATTPSNPTIDYYSTVCTGCGVSSPVSAPAVSAPTTVNNGNYSSYGIVSPTNTSSLWNSSSYLFIGNTPGLYGYYGSYVAPTVSWTGYNYTGSTYVPPVVYPTTPTVTQPQTQQCWNGTVIPVTQSCPAQTQTQQCWNGTVIPVGQLCPAVPTQCPSGTTLINGVCTANTVVQPPVIYTPPVYTSPTISYQTCWDGSTLPYYSTCPSQYKVCANGTSVPIYQTCYYGNTYVPYVAPQVTKFNSVVTSIATQVTMNSGRCNGIGLIANNAQSTGWFEFGETPSLGRTTTSSAIGSSDTAPFSNVLTNLKAHTTYYCRAVMQNQYGIVKGDIVPFTTKSTNVTYVRPVSKTVIKNTTTTTKKNQIICIDGSIVSVGSQSSATLLSQGEKLVALQMVKTGGTLSANDTVSYNLSYKNLSDSRLTNVVVKVTIPQEITNVNSTVGNYDEATHILTLNQDTIDPYTEGVITWTGKVSSDAPVGKSIVTTAYVVYTVPSTSVQDEVTAYVVGSIIPSTDKFADTGAKNVIGAGSDRGFLPNSLVEWLALIAIAFIIYILGRSVYASYKEDKK